MSAQILDGKALAAEIRSEVKTQVAALAEKGVSTALAVILVGDDSASQVYVRNKIKACADTGIRSLEFRMPAETTQQQLLAKIAELNADESVDGILVQLPLPKQINADAVIAAIDPAKDVDGFHVANAGALITGKQGFVPCTPFGVMRLIEKSGVNPRGKSAVIVGRSNIVGKPMALLLLAADATVTVAHSRTPDLSAVTRNADILVAAVGRAKLIKADMVKPGAVVIDVGMNRDENGKLCGDVDFAEVKEIAGSITPVPGGVGPMTIAMLMQNTVLAAQMRRGISLS
ncbi:bifunctional methylenetetrahydrofolate dehydrogenase/methenyltetrahydrofolate cyclohydrolase FolD [Sutterella sp. AM11-39]|uniref:bifunctional methylenetetrahydrofolate dehydrogenase/methenyltetrahydrofolate cyclohydrolase FolD n=1 Tax=Sutterella sp. AM11-39 TaxID=2292075 RepID=UPI000E503818|nr:bifunctional methylenetetrahydrofolate dehydrogenase/methenyltetrahydrofolate cyclohydrolase FolD [Sutterella sp. AM11-39]RHJ31771.1 bifunctional methylenetetrahydrofolate dehydrogenase/methenyltetrahydrofolate cyclohydrolase FolD [Sutterella sp. AM11-39]